MKLFILVPYGSFPLFLSTACLNVFVHEMFLTCFIISYSKISHLQILSVLMNQENINVFTFSDKNCIFNNKLEMVLSFEYFI